MNGRLFGIAGGDLRGGILHGLYRHGLLGGPGGQGNGRIRPIGMVEGNTVVAITDHEFQGFGAGQVDTDGLGGLAAAQKARVGRFLAVHHDGKDHTAVGAHFIIDADGGRETRGGAFKIDRQRAFGMRAHAMRKFLAGDLERMAIDTAGGVGVAIALRHGVEIHGFQQYVRGIQTRASGRQKSGRGQQAQGGRNAHRKSSIRRTGLPPGVSPGRAAPRGRHIDKTKVAGHSTAGVAFAK